MEVFGAVLTVCQTLYELGEAGRVNTEECRRLAKLGTLVKPVVQSLRLKHQQSSGLDPGIELYLTQLKEALMRAQELVQKMQSRNLFKVYQRGDEVNRAINQIHDILHSLSAYRSVANIDDQVVKHSQCMRAKKNKPCLPERIAVQFSRVQRNRNCGQMLEEQGVNATLSNQELLQAVESTDIKKIKGCIRNGALPTARNNSGQTPLHVAAINGRADIIKLLLASGANANIKDYNGNTALHLSSYWGYLDASKALIDQGAKLDVENNEGKTPRSSIAFGDTRKMTLLLEASQ